MKTSTHSHTPMKKRSCNFVLPPSLDKALGYAAVEQGKDRSALVAEALNAYLPVISKNPLVLEAIKEAPIAALL